MTGQLLWNGSFIFLCNYSPCWWARLTFSGNCSHASFLFKCQLLLVLGTHIMYKGCICINYAWHLYYTFWYLHTFPNCVAWCVWLIFSFTNNTHLIIKLTHKLCWSEMHSKPTMTVLPKLLQLISFFFQVHMDLLCVPTYIRIGKLGTLVFLNSTKS